jgi:hypothetical protein
MQTSSSPSSAAADQHPVQECDDGLAALEREALLPDVLGLQEGLEGLRRVEAAQDPQLLVAGHLLVRDLDALLDPLPLLGVLDVHVLHADGAAVGVAQDAQDLAQLEEGLAAEAAGGDLAVQVPQGQTVAGDVECRVRAGTPAGRCRPSGARARGRRG